MHIHVERGHEHTRTGNWSERGFGSLRGAPWNISFTDWAKLEYNIDCFCFTAPRIQHVGAERGLTRKPLSDQFPVRVCWCARDIVFLFPWYIYELSVNPQVLNILLDLCPEINLVAILSASDSTTPFIHTSHSQTVHIHRAHEHTRAWNWSESGSLRGAPLDISRCLGGGVDAATLVAAVLPFTELT